MNNFNQIFDCWSKLSSYRHYILWVGPKYYLKNELWFVRRQNDDGLVIINFKENKAIKSSSVNSLEYSILHLFKTSKTIYAFTNDVWF